MTITELHKPDIGQSEVERRATIARVYEFARTVPELAVSASGEFMTPEEFVTATSAEGSLFYVATINGSFTGFLLASIGDLDTGGDKKQACIVYVATVNLYRRRGIADNLILQCLSDLKKKGVEYVYTWADKDSGVMKVLERSRFKTGKACVWMDCHL